MQEASNYRSYLNFGGGERRCVGDETAGTRKTEGGESIVWRAKASQK